MRTRLTARRGWCVGTQVLNSLAVTKICKKHDKYSALKLSTTVLALVTAKVFYTSTRLATTFTHAQCIASEILTAATSITPQSADYTCSICLDLLSMPVVLSCTHRFCYGCLATASFHDHHCPLCKKETDLDPCAPSPPPPTASHPAYCDILAGSPPPPAPPPLPPLPFFPRYTFVNPPSLSLSLPPLP